MDGNYTTKTYPVTQAINGQVLIFTISGYMSIKQKAISIYGIFWIAKGNPDPAKDPKSFKNMQNNRSKHN